jgi:DNA-binding MarR family transcriptional regulator
MSSTEDREDLVDALAQLSFVVQNALAEIAGEYEASLVLTRLLGVLRDREPLMSELGRHLGLDKSSISGLVDRAQRRGLVTRTADPADRRAFRVSITDEGQRVAAEVAERFAGRIDALVQGLSEVDRELLTRLAGRIVEAGTPPGIEPATRRR